MASRRNTQNASISFSASGNSTVIANPSTVSFMYIWELALVLAGASNITLYNGAGALTGAMPMLANGSIYEGDFGQGTPHYTIDPGASFIINSSNAVQVSGKVKYSN
jgi:hypothetical protein